MNGTKSEILSPGEEKARIRRAVSELEDCPVVHVSLWCEYGEEHFHPDVGSYWKPRNIKVRGDMDDPTVLTVLSKLMDKYGLMVHNHHGVEECGDDWARLVVDRTASPNEVGLA